MAGPSQATPCSKWQETQRTPKRLTHVLISFCSSGEYIQTSDPDRPVLMILGRSKKILCAMTPQLSFFNQALTRIRKEGWINVIVCWCSAVKHCGNALFTRVVSHLHPFRS
jgi:hypothetical protein